MSEAPALELRQVHARIQGGEPGQRVVRLLGLSLHLGPGLHAVLGAPADGTTVLAEVAAGRLAPTSGSVRVGGRDPRRSPAIRRRIGALGTAAELPEADRVAQAVALAARAGGWDGASALETLSLGHLAPRRLPSLSAAELRSVELALALAVPSPALVVAFEPFSRVLPSAALIARELLRERADAGACVLVATSCPQDVLGWADQTLLLHRGQGIGVLGGEATDSLGASHELVLWLDGAAGGGARALAAHLSQHPALRAVGWHADAAPAMPGAASTLEVVALRAADIDRAALAVAESCARLGIEVRALHSPVPTLQQLTAATLAARAEAARRSELARQAGATPPPAAPVDDSEGKG